MAYPAKSPAELQRELGEAFRRIRISRRLTQKELAEKAGVVPRSIIKLERGAGSTVETMVRALNALGAAEAISLLAPVPQISPMALLRHEARQPKRVRHSLRKP